MKKARFTKGISISLDPEQHEKIRVLTDEQGISVGEWFRGLAEDALQSYFRKKAHEAKGGTREGSQPWTREIL